jgi:hypothetical protein
MLEIFQRILAAFIIERLWADNEFLNYSVNEDSFVNQGKLVIVPQAGSIPTATKNRTVVPAVVTKRNDTTLVYEIDEYTTDPTLLDFKDGIELSYDKLESVLGDHMNVLNNSVARSMPYNWVRSSTFTGAGTVAHATSIPTTGGTVAAHVANTTGNRKAVHWKDFKEARKILNKQNMPKNDRYALLSSDMYSQLFEDVDLLKRDVGAELDLKEGRAPRLFGFEIIERSEVVLSTAAGVVKDPDALTVATDSDAAVFWQKSAVTKAQGEIKTFQNVDDPQHYGSIYSCLVRFGGRKRRLNGDGVILLYQATV